MKDAKIFRIIERIEEDFDVEDIHSQIKNYEILSKFNTRELTKIIITIALAMKEVSFTFNHNDFETNIKESFMFNHNGFETNIKVCGGDNYFKIVDKNTVKYEFDAWSDTSNKLFSGIQYSFSGGFCLTFKDGKLVDLEDSDWFEKSFDYEVMDDIDEDTIEIIKNSDNAASAYEVYEMLKIGNDMINFKDFDYVYNLLSRWVLI